MIYEKLGGTNVARYAGSTSITCLPVISRDSPGDSSSIAEKKLRRKRSLSLQILSYCTALIRS